MISFLQINLRKSGSARRLLEQTSRELSSDILILSEVPSGSPESHRWITSLEGKATVALTSTVQLAPVDSGKGPGFAYM